MRSLEIDGFVALATISLIFSRCLAPTVHVKAWLQVKNIIYFRIICFEIYEFYLQLPVLVYYSKNEMKYSEF